MRAPVRLILLLAAGARPWFPQDLAPRAYLVTPVGSNAVTFTYAFSRSSIPPSRSKI
jgi:hypothetical protein